MDVQKLTEQSADDGPNGMAFLTGSHVYGKPRRASTSPMTPIWMVRND